MIDLNYKYDIIHRIKSRSIVCDNGCIEYQRGKLKHKYGLVSITVNGKRKSVPVHRALWIATHGLWELSRHVVIRHKCDNQRCVNIEHLVDGTSADNTHDCIERGRRATKYKLHTRQRVVSDDIVRAIRASQGKIKSIAVKFGVSNGYVSKLRNKKAKTLV